jgi:hypothetical protein
MLVVRPDLCCLRRPGDDVGLGRHQPFGLARSEPYGSREAMILRGAQLEARVTGITVAPAVPTPARLGPRPGWTPWDYGGAPSLAGHLFRTTGAGYR